MTNVTSRKNENLQILRVFDFAHFVQVIFVISRVFVFQYYFKLKLNNRYYLHHLCYWFLYAWMELIERIILVYVASYILG